MPANKIEQYLIDTLFTYRALKNDLWLLEDPEHNLDGVAVMYSDPLVIFRTVVMEAPRENRLELFTKLLELNVKDIIHGAYGLEDNKIVLIDTLEYATMDYQEFRASLEAFSLALTEHYPVLSKYREKQSG